MLLLLSIFLLSFIPISFSLAPKGPWDSFNYAPQSRTVRPKSIRGTVGAVEGAHNLINSTNGLATLLGNSYVTVDFDIEVNNFSSNLRVTC